MRFLICSGIILATAFTATAYDPGSPLHGIDSLRIIVEDLPQVAAEMNLTAPAIHDTMSAMLNQHMILTDVDRSTPFVLYVVVTIRNAGEQTCYHIDLTFFEYMANLRTNSVVPARLWNDAYLGQCAQSEAGNIILREVKTLVENFVLEHYFANH